MLILLLSLLHPAGAGASGQELRRYQTYCGPVSGLRLVREVDAEAQKALDEWYAMLEVEGDYVHKCQQLGADMKQAGDEMRAFRDAQKKYFAELAKFQKNTRRIEKVRYVQKILKDGGDDDCRKALDEEAKMHENRKTVLRNVNCNRR